MPPFRLQTLGSLSLHDSSGDVIPGQGPQRRRLALLAALAVSGDRAGAATRSSPYSGRMPHRSGRVTPWNSCCTRSAFAGNAAFLGVNPISLNPEVIV